MGQHLILNIIPNNFTVGIGRKFWWLCPFLCPSCTERYIKLKPLQVLSCTSRARLSEYVLNCLYIKHLFVVLIFHPSKWIHPSRGMLLLDPTSICRGGSCPWTGHGTRGQPIPGSPQKLSALGFYFFLLKTLPAPPDLIFLYLICLSLFWRAGLHKTLNEYISFWRSQKPVNHHQ